MKEFYNILEAANYHKECYRCGGNTRIYFHKDLVDGETLSDHRGEFYQLIKINLSSGVDSDTDDILTINPVNNKIDLQSISRRKHFDTYGCDYSGQTPLKFSPRYPIRNYLGDAYGGTLYESLEIGCSKCHNFNYIIQMVIDTKEGQIKHLFLNSEYIIWTDTNNTHEIRNVYATNKTECALFKGMDKIKRITIPIIPLNLSNPSETIERIKKLNIFS